MTPHRTQPRSDLAAAIVLCGAAVGLALAPASMSVPIRACVRDSLRPGHKAADWVTSKAESLAADFQVREVQAAMISELRADLDAVRLAARQEQLQVAALRKLLAADDSEGHAASGEPLLIPELLEARILGREEARVLASGTLIDRGADAGMIEESLVVEATIPLIDHGEGSKLEPGLPVYAGRAVVGKIAQAGRWVSTVRPVTDPQFRGEARLARSTAQGLALGARGVICGTGEALCKLTWIAATEPVSVGDEVYTDTSLPQPMYYGKVVRVEPGLTHWEIWVEPAAADPDRRTVQVLRRRLNPARVLAN